MKPIKYALRFSMLVVVSLITNGCADIDDEDIDHEHARTRTTTTTTTEERHVAPVTTTTEETHVTRY